MPSSPHSTEQAMAWLREQRDDGTRWSQLCLMLTREARDIPPRYPSALAAQLATPREDRVHDKAKWKRGMVAFFDNAADGNPYGHIVTLAMRNREGTWLSWTNIVGGAVRLVPITLFTEKWGDPAQFAAVSLNGYDLKGFEEQTSTKSKATRERALANAARTLRTEAEIQDTRGHPARARALRKDIEILRRRHPEVFEDE